MESTKGLESFYDDKFAGSAIQKDVPDCADNEYKEVAWAIPKYGEKFAPIWINRPKVGDYDVRF